MKNKLVNVHFFIFASVLVLNMSYYILESNSKIKELKDPVKYCRYDLVKATINDITYLQNILMILLLIYMIEKISTVPLQPFW